MITDEEEARRRRSLERWETSVRYAATAVMWALAALLFLGVYALADLVF